MLWQLQNDISKQQSKNHKDALDELAFAHYTDQGD